MFFPPVFSYSDQQQMTLPVYLQKMVNKISQFFATVYLCGVCGANGADLIGDHAL